MVYVEYFKRNEITIQNYIKFKSEKLDKFQFKIFNTLNTQEKELDFLTDLTSEIELFTDYLVLEVEFNYTGELHRRLKREHIKRVGY